MNQGLRWIERVWRGWFRQSLYDAQREIVGGGDQDGIFALDAEGCHWFFLHCAHWIIIIAMIGDVNDIRSFAKSHSNSNQNCFDLKDRIVLKPAWTKRTSFLISVSKALPSIFAFLSASKIYTNAKRRKKKIGEKKKSESRGKRSRRNRSLSPDQDRGPVSHSCPARGPFQSNLV